MTTICRRIRMRLKSRQGAKPSWMVQTPTDDQSYAPTLTLKFGEVIVSMFR